MIEHLTSSGYEATKTKLALMEQRLAALDLRTDVSPDHKEATRQSYLRMIARYRAEINLYEMTQKIAAAT